MERTIFIKIILLDRQERPIENISGRATQGSISISGQSALQRTCNITLVPEKIDFNRYQWALNNKFKVEIGVLQEDETIYWYPQGVYIIKSFSAALSPNNYQVSISGQDKLALLNGSISGHITAPLDAGREEIEQPNGMIVYRDRPIKEIIRDVVHKFGGEAYQNILINDLEDKGKILQAYAYSKDLYLGRYANSNDWSYAFWGDRQFTVDGETKSLDDWAKDESIIFDYLDSLHYGVNATTFKYGGTKEFKIARFTYGETIGYKNTDLTYPGELIANPGEAITSLLDKIVQVLGEFEYFYNLQGQFIFQRKKIYANTPFSPYDKQLGWIDLNAQKLAYKFPNLEMISNFNDNYTLDNVKNDFTIWGEREGLGGGKIPIHLRYAIDKKPAYYHSITVTEEELKEYNQTYGFNLKGQIGRVYEASSNDYIDEQIDVCNGTFYLQTEAATNYSSGVLELLFPVFTLNAEKQQVSLHQTPVKCDWREIIYQMARDYTRYGHLDNFLNKVIEANSDKNLYVDGLTGYEQYYLDIESFWRQLYNPWAYVKNRSIVDSESFEKVKAKETLFYRGDLGQIYIPVNPNDKYDETVSYYSKDTNFYGSDAHGNFPWNKDVFYAPHKLNFWFDFLDTQGAMQKYSVAAIGTRTLVDSKSKVRAIHYEEVPNLLFLDDENPSAEGETAYRKFQLGDYSDMFVTSAQGSSAKETLDSLLFDHTLATESVTMSALPVYDLLPNTLIEINAPEANISGEYIVNSINIPLTYNGMMSINAMKCSVFEDNDASAILGQAILGLMILGAG